MPTKKQPLKVYDFDATITVRVKLTAEQKQLIKEAYDKKFYETTPANQTTNNAGTVKVQTIWNAPDLTKAMGADRYTLSSLLGSQTHYPVAQLQKWERALDIDLVDKKILENAWKGYIAHVFAE